MRNRTYFENKADEIRDIVATSTVLVASNPQDSGQIFGYLVGTKIKGLHVIHYTYVKSAFRKLGIAGDLVAHFYGGAFPKEEIGITSMGPVVSIIKDRYNLVYNPYLTKIMEDLKAYDVGREN
ncbi:MAG: hypothetical protein HC883_02075 [Bdellovibrionaceae bacterium]|nr:hypothetical protein [Pseudobdellovibrionaceae bacterium]